MVQQKARDHIGCGLFVFLTFNTADYYVAATWSKDVIMMNMKILPMVAAVALFSSCAFANYPVTRMQGTIVSVNKNLTGMRISSSGKVHTVELGFASSVRQYEMRLTSNMLRIGDEISMFENGKSRVVYDKAVTGVVTSQNPLKFTVMVYPTRSNVEPKEGVFNVGDYATLEVKKWQPPKTSRVPKYSRCILYAPSPSHIKTYTITKPERVEFTRFRRRKLSDLVVNQTISVYMAVIPNNRLRSRGIAILVDKPQK